MERTNWALSTWNSTLDRNDGPTAWLYGQDLRPCKAMTDTLTPVGHLWSAPIGHYRPGILPLTGMMALRPGCMVRIYGLVKP